MPKNEIKNAIREHLFFKHFKEEEIDILVNCSSLVSFNENEYLTTAKKDSKIFYLILSGSVSLQLFSHERGIIELETIQSGEFIGWSWLVAPYKWHFDSVAMENTKTICFDAVDMKKEMEKNPEFGYKMYKIFTSIIIERLQAERANILDVYDKLLIL